jgi:hypothetical protein
MIAARFAPATCLVLVLGLVPTVIHGYRGLTLDDGLRTSAIPAELAGLRSQPTGRKASWAMDVLASNDFIERVYRNGSDDVQLFVARSFDAKRLYHHPELAILRGTNTTPAGRSRLPGRPDVPLHVLRTSRGGQNGIAAYALHYDGTYVERPMLFQMRTAVALLFSGRKPMTLFLASDSSGSPDRLDSSPAAALLKPAIEAFERQQTALSLSR